MKLEKWWKCLGCDQAYKHLAPAAKCHRKGVERITLLVDDNGSPVNPIAPRRMRDVQTDEDDAFGLMSDLVGPL